MVAIIISLLMTYFMFWMSPETCVFGVLPAFMSYVVLFMCFSIIAAGVLYELKTEFRIYYICQSCYRNFVLDGRKNPDPRCPFCSSKDLHILTTITKKEQPRGLVWNPPEDKDLKVD